MLKYPGLFTSRDCCAGEEGACEAVVNYREQVTMMPV